MRALAVVMVLAAIPCAVAEATPCQIGTFQSYIDLGSGGCTLEDKTVFGFLDLGVLGSASSILSSITVTPDPTPGNPGLIFGFGAAASAGELLQALFALSVSVDAGGSPISAVSLSLDGSSVAPDGVNTALLCLDTTDPACPTPDVLILFDIGIDSLLTDALALGPVGALDLVADFVVDAGVSGSASLSTATLRFQEVQAAPEPSVFPLMVAGLLMLARGRGRSTQ